MRSNFSTQAAMAWALYRNGQLSEAVEYMNLAVSSGVRDAQILSTAATLLQAAGNAAESQHYAQAALRINPKHRIFTCTTNVNSTRINRHHRPVRR
jgi:Tfp pilus assembly protein PilF